MVLGVEMSRLARSCRDWHQLLEICALFDTLIADADGVYDPANFNDRLLLGLKGTMSEAELHILKARMLAGKRAKARRGELGRRVPMGYVQRPSGEIAFDPDEQAQATIRLVFELFDRFRTVGKVMRYLVDHDIRMPVRVPGGAPARASWSGIGSTGFPCTTCFPIRSMRGRMCMACVRPTRAGRSQGGRARGGAAVRRRRRRCSCPVTCRPTSIGSNISATGRSCGRTSRLPRELHAPASRYFLAY